MILKKEFIHIFRDKITLFLVLAMPIALVLLFGFTISSEIRNAKISVLDQAKDTQSMQLCKKLSASGYFQIVSYLFLPISRNRFRANILQRCK